MKKYFIRPSDMRKIKRYLRDVPKMKRKVVKTIKKNISKVNGFDVTELINKIKIPTKVKEFLPQTPTVVVEKKKKGHLLGAVIGAAAVTTVAAVAAIAVSKISFKPKNILINKSK